MFKDQKGQTLIETLAAVFILVMGITAAMGLSLFAYSSSTNITKQIIATALAREGIEAVKNMRDTNWLKIPNIDKNCYNYQSGVSTPDAVNCPGSGTGGACCYKNWLNPTGGFNYNLNPPSDNKSYRLVYNPGDALFWDLQIENSKYGLNFDSNITGMPFSGFYKPETSQLNGSSDYYRKITLRTDGNNSADPFNKDIGPRLQVISQVWWTDKKCPRATDWPGTGKCAVEIQTFLTNWKNY
jgi:type II secretory pathway pseudopilin PulG